MAKNKLPFSSLVYSTDPDFINREVKEEAATPSPDLQQLKIVADKKHRAGKVVTLVTGFSGKEQDAEELGRKLKSVCGTGGSVKDGTIIIQGDNREKVFQWLLKNGYKQVKKM